MTIGSVRRSQLISIFGVGAIIPMGDESYMVAGLEYWPSRDNYLYEFRLQRKLNVVGFRTPPASEKEKGRDVPVIRFPEFYSCPVCKRFDRFFLLANPNSGKCLNCNVRLIPSRFVVACENGHIDDFPFSRWVHRGTVTGKHELSLVSAGASASLKDVVIECSCGASESMEGSFNRYILGEVTRCTGKRPWLKDREECDATPRATQRGASNVHFPNTVSALSIPPWSEGAHRRIQAYWQMIQHLPDRHTVIQVLTSMGVADETYGADELADVVMDRKSESDAKDSSLLEDEYKALIVGKPESGEVQDFVCVPAKGADECSEIFSKVMAVSKLKEIRALTGFTRLLPCFPNDPPNRIAKLAGMELGWLPAIEVSGEGGFFMFSEEALEHWESNETVKRRAGIINERYIKRFKDRGTEPEKEITSRLILLHTFAHALIREWSLECGYPTGDLRERLYVSGSKEVSSMSGVLIYTATSDAAGSLGGLVSLLDVGKLRNSVLNAIGSSSWCSSDPICIETEAGGLDSLNMAACHACVLLPETSCTEQNLLLDRAMLVGTAEQPEIGFFGYLFESKEI